MTDTKPILAYQPSRPRAERPIALWCGCFALTAVCAWWAATPFINETAVKLTWALLLLPIGIGVGRGLHAPRDERFAHAGLALALLACLLWMAPLALLFLAFVLD